MSGSVGDRDNISGDLQVTVPTGGYTRGSIYLIADSYWIARETALAAALALVGVPAGLTGMWVTKAAATGKNFAIGDKVYVKSNVAENATSTGAVLLPWVALAVAAATDTKVFVGLPGAMSPAAT